MSQAGPLSAAGSNPQIPTSFVTDSGTAVPALNTLNIFGGTDITTAGSGHTVTINFTGASGVVTSVTGTANQITASPTTGAVVLSLTNGVSIGSYQATSPPTGGLLVPGIVGIGTNSVDSIGQLQVSSALARGFELFVNNTVLDGSNASTCFFGSYTQKPSSAAINLYNNFVSGSFDSTSANITNCYGQYYTISTGLGLSSNTISNIYGLFVGTIGIALQPVTHAYGGYFDAQSGAATSNIPLYADAQSIGYTTTTPPTNGIIVSGISGFGTNSAGTTAQVNIAPSISSGAIVSGLLVQPTYTNASGTFYGEQNLSTFTVNVGSWTAAYGENIAPTASIRGGVGGGTLTTYYGVNIAPSISASAGAVLTAISNIYSLKVAGINVSSGTPTTTSAYSIFVTAPSSSVITNKVAIYTDNLAVGTSGTTPPTNGILCLGTIQNTALTASSLVSTDSSKNLVSTSLPLSLANGGTNANLTASNGGIFYSTATSGAILSGTATANQVLLSGTSAAPSWSTATYPATTTINQLLYSSASNTIGGITAANNGVLLSGTTGIPSWLAAGTTGQVLIATTSNPASWGTLSSIAVTSITGTANQITASASTGAVTLALSSTIITPGTIAINGLTQGSLLFSGASSVVSQDNANLFWDATNHRLGLGTTGPLSRLDVSGGIAAGTYAGSSAAPSNSIIVSGGLGVGTTTLGSATSRFSAITAYNVHVFGTQTADDGAETIGILFNGTISPTANSRSIYTLYLTGPLVVANGNTAPIVTGLYTNINTSANVGTINDCFGILVDGGVSPTGTILRGYGGYFKNPAYGTTKNALYCDNLSVGFTATAPPSSGAVFSGQVAMGTSTAATSTELTISSSNYALKMTGGTVFNYTATATDYSVLISDYFIGVTNTSASRTITLPGTVPVAGWVVVIKDESGGASTHNIIIAGNGHNIDGGANATIVGNYSPARLYSNGTQYYSW